MPDRTWNYEGHDPAQERLRESLCTLGNGYFATRGAVPEATAGTAHYPGTYAAGCYNRLTSTVAGRTVENEDIVNLPNWLPLRFRARDATSDTDSDGGAAPGPWFSADDGSLLEYRQVLDLRQGTLTRRMRLCDAQGRRITVVQSRLVHMGDPHLAALRTEFTAEGWAGELEVESALDGDITNSGVDRYRDLNGRHLDRWHTGAAGPNTVWLECRTNTSDILIAMAARTQVAGSIPTSARLITEDRTATHALRLPIEPDSAVVVEKTVALHTSRDPAISDPLHAAIDRVQQAGDFTALLASHEAAWERLWQRAELEVPGEAGRVLRLHLFHVLQTLSPHTADLDVGVPARGLHGEAYRGHVFWDELFVLPFLNLHLPEVSRALLSYRYRRLGQACRTATAAGRTGAIVTAAWVLTRALELAEGLPAPRRQALFERIGLDAGELKLWEDVSHRLRVPFHRGVISQFEGYGDLAELDWDAYRARHGDIRRLDRILEAEGDTVNAYQASKQADVLMLGYLFSPAELTTLFRRLGYGLDDEMWRTTVDHYLRRTSHGSTLSGLVHGWVLARARRAGAWKYCQEALTGDVADLQGGTTAEGIHLGAMAGTLDLVQRGLTGLEVRGDELSLDPAPLPELSEYGLSIRYRGHRGIGLTLHAGNLSISVPPSDQPPVRIRLAGRSLTLAPGTSRTLQLPTE
ncbi:glycoside hydrolase family 65 protein [Streptomyces sp. RKAG337]|uniref:glycoside hydrolase family 65 protein n=1 Tax=Streptomyces sp. RKAG337 TaxID=2893404 RepID=UPI0020342F65|nr:glycosyl hydrolase family 65 protein [Streptomyces sp. RKAG337]MCM2425161.1 hypothetical protein [Streptomyces sp. RKAG337]